MCIAWPFIDFVKNKAYTVLKVFNYGLGSPTKLLVHPLKLKNEGIVLYFDYP